MRSNGLRERLLARSDVMADKLTDSVANCPKWVTLALLQATKYVYTCLFLRLRLSLLLRVSDEADIVVWLLSARRARSHLSWNLSGCAATPSGFQLPRKCF